MLLATEIVLLVLVSLAGFDVCTDVHGWRASINSLLLTLACLAALVGLEVGA